MSSKLCGLLYTYAQIWNLYHVLNGLTMHALWHLWYKGCTEFEFRVSAKFRFQYLFGDTFFFKLIIFTTFSQPFWLHFFQLFLYLTWYLLTSVMLLCLQWVALRVMSNLALWYGINSNILWTFMPLQFFTALHYRDSYKAV